MAETKQIKIYKERLIMIRYVNMARYKIVMIENVNIFIQPAKETLYFCLKGDVMRDHSLIKKNDGTSMVFMVLPWYYHGFHDTTMVLPWYGCSPWYYHGITMVLPWYYHGTFGHHGTTMSLPW